MTDDQKYLVSCDTLKKVNVANFPNVFNLQSVLLEHTQELRDMCTIGNDRVASISDPDQVSQEQDLIISAIANSEVIFRMKYQGIKQIAATSQGGLVFYKEDGSISELVTN